MDTTLEQRLHDYILKSEPVTMTDIYTLGKNKYSTHEINTALRKVHKMKDISRRMKGGDVVYTKSKPKEKEQLPTSKVDPEYRARLEKEYENMCNSLTPEQSAHADRVFEGVAEFIWIDDSLVPKVNEEHYKQVLNKKKHVNTRR